MSSESSRQLDKIAFGTCLAGVLLAVVIGVIGSILEKDLVMPAYGVFAAFELAAFVLGIITRAEPLGKAASITSGLLLVGSLLFLG